MKPAGLLVPLVLVLCSPAGHSQSATPSTVDSGSTDTNNLSIPPGYTNAVEAAARLGLQNALAEPASAPSPASVSTNSVAPSDTSQSLTPAQTPSAPPPPDEIQISGGVALAQYGPLKATFSGNLNTSSPLALLTPDGLQIRSQIYGLCFYSPGSGQSLLFAWPQDCQGEVVAPNTITYTNAFEGAECDVSYSYGRAAPALVQDIVIRKALPDPSSLGFPKDVRLAVITEFLDGPAPVVIPSSIDLTALNQQFGIQGENSLPDCTLFLGGAMRLEAGASKAFSLGDSSTAVPSAKSIILDSEGGHSWFLVESTPWNLLSAQIQALPAGTLHAQAKPSRSLKTMLAEAPRPRRGNDSSQRICLAKAADTRPGVVLDYLMVTSPLINVDCGGASPEKVGPAAVGQGTNDFWTTCMPNSTPLSLANLKWSDSTTSSVGLVVSNAPGGWGNGSTDPMYNSYLYLSNGTITLTITNLPSNSYNFYLYGRAASAVANSTFQLYRAGSQIAYKGTSLWGQGWNSTNWEPGLEYQVFKSITVTNQTIQVVIPPGGDGYAYINGLQIVPSAAVPPANVAISNLINVDFGGYSTSKVGVAAVGLSTNDFWNGYWIPNASSGSVAPLTNSARTASTAGLTVLNALGGWGNGINDPMYSTYLYVLDAGNITVTLTNLQAGNYDFYLYGHAAADNANCVFQLWTGDRDCDLRGTSIWGSGWNSGTAWDESQQFVVYRDIWVQSNQPVIIVAGHDINGYANLCGMQIVYKGSADTNSNGLPDAWERYFFGNLNQSASGDHDGDFLSNIREYHLGLDPTRTNSFPGAIPAIPDWQRSEVVWVEDSTPGGCYTNDYSTLPGPPYPENWNWTFAWNDGDGWGGNNVYAYSGRSMHVSALVTNNIHEHWLDKPDTNFLVNVGDSLFTYINLDSSYPPSEIMLQWYVMEPNGAGSWEHRAYWGGNLISWGTNGTASRYYAGTLPSAGQWVRLAVPASALGLEGKVIQGITFTLYGGRAAWDRAGKFISNMDGNGLPDSWEMQYFGHIGVDPNDDPDGDGISNYTEYLNGSNPVDPWLVGWGKNDFGQTTAPAGLGLATAVDGGFGGTLALRTNGLVAAWGDNAHNQTNVPADVSNVVSIVAAAYQNLARKADGTVAQWGMYSDGPNYYAVGAPTGLTNVKQIAAGLEHALALKADGSLVPWGVTNAIANSAPTNLAGVKAITAGWRHNAALLSNGTVVAWGDNVGQLGWNVTNVPVGLSNVIAIAAGEYHTLALKTDTTVSAWGAGQIGRTNGGEHGQSVVPAGLSNVVAVAGGGFSSMALKADGTVVAWGELSNAPVALNQVVAIGTGDGHCLAERVGRQTPLLTLQPQSQCVLAGTNLTFSASGIGPASVSYQWQFNNLNVAGATTSALTINNVQTANQGNYQVVVSNGAGSITSQVATLNVVGPPLIASQTQPSNLQILYGGNLTLSVRATNTGSCSFPITYQWSLNSNVIYSAMNGTNYTITSAANSNAGVYSVLINNGACCTNTSWTVDVAGEGHAIWWGNMTQAWNYVPGVTNAIGLAGGGNHGLLVEETGAVVAWGTNSFGQTNVPPWLTNAVAVAAGDAHSLALNTDGSVVAWGRNDLNQTNVPGTVTNVIAISAGGNQSLALKKDGSVVQWGQTFASVPANVTNVSAVASGTNFHLALLTNGTVAAWGNNANGQATVPPWLTNVVAVAGGGDHALALRASGTVVAWGNNSSGQTNVPGNLTNVMAIAAGYTHSMALRNDGTLVTWGNNTYGQTNAPPLSNLKLIAAGGYQGLVSIFSPLVQYPVEVTKGLLLIYNTNSQDSSNVWSYYMQHRPMISGANVLPIGCAPQETVNRADFTNTIRQPILSWLNGNPTKRPQYWILFLDIPSRINETTNAGSYGVLPKDNSVSYELNSTMQNAPFVTHINMNGTNDCKAYIDKLEFIGTNYSPGKLILSASVGGYGNTNYYFDDTRFDNTPGVPSAANNAKTGVLGVNPTASIVYTNGGQDYDTNLLLHIRNGTNVAGYLSWGAHSALDNQYLLNGYVNWSGNSRWWIIATVESVNGLRFSWQGNFLQWFSGAGFGGTNYSNTPVGAVSHIEEPGFLGNYADQYFGRWEAGKNFAICAWTSRWTPYFQAVGDPLLTK